MQMPGDAIKFYKTGTGQQGRKLEIAGKCVLTCKSQGSRGCYRLTLPSAAESGSDLAAAAATAACCCCLDTIFCSSRTFSASCLLSRLRSSAAW